MEGKDNKKSSIIVQQQNEPIELSTPISFARIKKKPEGSHLHFSHCDDVVGENRLHVAIFHPDNEDDKHKYIDIYTQNNSHYFYKSNFDKLAYKARKEGKKEILIDSLVHKFDKCGSSIEAYALVDLEARCVYGIRFNFTAGASTTTSYFVVPALSDKC